MSAHRPSSVRRSRRLALQSFRVASLSGLAVLASLALASCTGDEPVVVVETATASPSATADATEAATPSPTATATSEEAVAESPIAEDADAGAGGGSAPFTADTLPDTETASAGAFLSPVDMRFGVHEGYDRIVIDLEGTGTPGWTAEYVDSPTGRSSGEPVVLDGGAYLRIVVTGVVYETEPGAQPYAGPLEFSPATGGVVEQVKYGSLFEGSVEIFVGVASEEPFRVFALTSPTRVVIDVQHP